MPGLVILCASSDPAISQALKSVDRGGTIILFAPKEPGGTYPFPLFDLWRDNITIINSYASPPLDTQMALDLIAAGRVEVKDMITHRLGLGEARRAFVSRQRRASPDKSRNRAAEIIFLSGGALKRIGLVVKVSNPDAITLADRIADWVTAQGGTVYTDEVLSLMVKNAVATRLKDLPGRIDIMIVLGGDGTMIHAARLIDGRKVPILGVNLGSLGFLTAITVAEVFPLLEKVMRDECAIEERMLLKVEHTRGKKSLSTHRVLNDAVIKGDNARLVRLETRINKEYVNTYRADGLIIATPTGSTAYSLSANGPILYPTIHSIIVAPICPFNLTNRPVVIPDWMTVDITVSPEQHGVELILDGQVDMPLDSGGHHKGKEGRRERLSRQVPGQELF